MNKKIKMITFDLDDTLWDNRPTIIKAEVDTRKWIEDQVGEVEWGDFNDFLELREELIKEDKSIAWDISKLRKEIFRKKLSHVNPIKLRNEIVESAFDIFISKRHEIVFFDGVEECISDLSKKYLLGILTNGNADIYKFKIGKYFKFSFTVKQQVSRASKQARQLRVSSTPMMIVDGKYIIESRGSYEKIMKVVDHVVELQRPNS